MAGCLFSSKKGRSGEKKRQKTFRERQKWPNFQTEKNVAIMFPKKCAIFAKSIIYYKSEKTK
jgi:hypothetical protein